MPGRRIERAPRGLALPRRVAGVAGDRGDLAGAAVAGGAAAQDPGDLQAPIQKDSAPFPGLDEREFWQRVEARNKETAAVLDRLGLAEYFAMEAYVVA